MGQSAIMAAVTAKDPAAMRAAFVGELVPAIPDATDPVTWDPRELGVAGGNVFPAVVWQAKLWFRDPADTTTLADEIECIVTSDGSRYKSDELRMPWSVLSRGLGTPPDPDDAVEANRPEVGQGWLVPAGATGAWATHEDELAVWTSRGWRYREPTRGHLLYVEDELGFIHYNSSDEWEDGTGVYGLPDGTITPNHLLIRDWQAENQTTTAPPATGPAGETYIVGASATGAWLGHDKKIAYRKTLNAAFTIVAPFVSEEVFDKNLNNKLRWNGSTWESAGGAVVGFKRVFTAASLTTNNVGSGTTAYSDTTAPGAHLRAEDTATLTYKAKNANNILRFTYQAKGVASNVSVNLIAAIRRANAAGTYETNAVDWHGFLAGASPSISMINSTFSFVAGDTDEHIYRFAMYRDNSAENMQSVSRRTFMVEEITP